MKLAGETRIQQCPSVSQAQAQGTVHLMCVLAHLVLEKKLSAAHREQGLQAAHGDGWGVGDEGCHEGGRALHK